MKSTGIVRRVDTLGRIVLPMELRNLLSIQPKDSLEIFIEGQNIILKKYEPQCSFCDNVDGIVEFKGRKVCSKCIEELKNSK